VRVLGRLARKAKAVLDESVQSGAPAERFRDRSRSAKRLTNKIAWQGRRLRSDTVRDAHQEAYGKLLKLARLSVGQVEQLVEMLGKVAGEQTESY